MKISKTRNFTTISVFYKTSFPLIGFSPGVAKNKFNTGMRPDSKKWLLYLKAMVVDNLLSENDSPSESKQKFTLII